MPRKICFVSLGCPKNLIDSERMLWLLNEAGYALCPGYDEADGALVNTCGFIQSSKSEAIENILELAEFKKQGTMKVIVAAGCLVERYREELLSQLPEVDGLVGVGGIEEIVRVFDEAFERAEKGAGPAPTAFGDRDAPLPEGDRVITTPDHMAYLKISDGCDNRCSYCAIPDIRGRLRSRAMEDILREAGELASSGVRELVLVAQDTTRYGLDLYGRRRLADLLRELVKLDGIMWIRLQYMYPDGFDEELIGLLASEPKLVKYLDIPIQHACDRILSAMRRRYNKKELETLIKTLRSRIKGLVLRTTVIVGFPGEDEAAFEELCTFMRKMRFERAGVFAYSREEGTPAFDLPDQVEDEVKEHRCELVNDLQADVMDAYNASRVGKTVSVLTEGRDKYGDCYFGRTYADAPEVDGKCFFDSELPVAEGEVVKVKVTEVYDADIFGVRI